MSSPEGIDRREALRRVGVLLGGLVSAPTAAGVLSGCERTSSPDWTPETLTTEQNEMVDTIAEIIIPATDTPGARAANVNRFVDTMVGDSYASSDRTRFLNGLASVNTRCEDRYGAVFLDCDAAQQRAFVAEMDDNTFGPDADSPGSESPSFYRMLKELVVIGYYTSEIGATQELRMSIAPGTYDGNVPYDEIGRAWSGAAT